LRGGIDAIGGWLDIDRVGGIVAPRAGRAIIGGLEIGSGPGGGGIDRPGGEEPSPCSVAGGGGKVPNAGGGSAPTCCATGGGEKRFPGGGKAPGGGVSPRSVDFIDVDGDVDGCGEPAAGTGECIRLTGPSSPLSKM
jgi:hypothetical protein